tara:strand:+ start:11740 stop:12861 length:1122 start_codon:yes stop_codon:yes gene_type:complete
MKQKIKQAKLMPESVIELSKGVYKYTSNKPFYFESKKAIPSLELQYESYGKLNKDKSNVILIHHSLSVGAHVARHNNIDTENLNDEPEGWWENFVGPNKALDTNKYYILCINNLGSCFGSSGPSLNSINSETNAPYLKNFPQVTFKDIVNSQRKLLSYLKIERLYAIFGSSMGGMISLTWLQSAPNMIEKIFLCATAYKAYSFNIANRIVQKEAILSDQKYLCGFYKKNPIIGLKLARKIGLLFYRGIPELNQRFSNKDADNIYSYYEYNAEKFTKAFDANSYVYILNCMDNFDLSKNKLNTNIFPKAKTKIFLVSIDNDLLFPSYQQEDLYLELKKSFKNISFIKHKTPYGHDSFFIETKQYSDYIGQFIIS